VHIYCKTERAVLLLGVSDDNKVKYFPHSLDDVLPGIIFNVRPLESINVQLQELAATFVGKDIAVDVIQEFSDTMPLNGELGDATVYLATCSLPRAAIKGPTINLPDLIRKTPSGRGRVILIKAMQIFAGALTEQSKAVDFDQAIRHFDK
jgi:hypothetical protein